MSKFSTTAATEVITAMHEGNSDFAKKLLMPLVQSGHEEPFAHLFAAIVYGWLDDQKEMIYEIAVALALGSKQSVSFKCVALIMLGRNQNIIAERILENGWERRQTRIPLWRRSVERAKYMSRMNRSIDIRTLPPAGVPSNGALDESEDIAAVLDSLRSGDVESVKVLLKRLLEARDPATSVLLFAAAAYGWLGCGREKFFETAISVLIDAVPELFAAPIIDHQIHTDYGEITHELIVNSLAQGDLDPTRVLIQRCSQSTDCGAHYLASAGYRHLKHPAEALFQMTVAIALEPTTLTAYKVISRYAYARKQILVQERILSTMPRLADLTFWDWRRRTNRENRMKRLIGQPLTVRN